MGRFVHFLSRSYSRAVMLIVTFSTHRYVLFTCLLLPSRCIRKRFLDLGFSVPSGPSKKQVFLRLNRLRNNVIHEANPLMLSSLLWASLAPPSGSYDRSLWPRSILWSKRDQLVKQSFRLWLQVLTFPTVIRFNQLTQYLLAKHFLMTR